MTKAWLETLQNGADIRAGIANAIPTLETERLTLRAPCLSDWETLEPAWTGQRAVHIGGPFNEEDAYLDFCQATACWPLRGFGPFTAVAKDTDEIVGWVGIFHDFGDPFCEAGWIMTQSSEGKGYATEAARAVLGFAKNTLGMTTIASFIDRPNAASIRVAEKLGATLDPTTVTFAGLPDDLDVLVYRHDLTDFRSDTIPMEFRRNSDSEKGGPQ